MKNKKTPTLYYVASLLFYLAAIISFAGGNRSFSPVMWIILGSLFICLGFLYAKKEKQEK